MAACHQCKTFLRHSINTIRYEPPQPADWGHRVAHCQGFNEDSRYISTGYYLEPAADKEYFHEFAKQHRKLTRFKQTFKALQVSSQRSVLMTCCCRHVVHRFSGWQAACSVMPKCCSATYQSVCFCCSNEPRSGLQRL